LGSASAAIASYRLAMGDDTGMNRVAPSWWAMSVDGKDKAATVLLITREPVLPPVLQDSLLMCACCRLICVQEVQDSLGDAPPFPRIDRNACW
jgi:hypothetical protein